VTYPQLLSTYSQPIDCDFSDILKVEYFFTSDYEGYQLPTPSSECIYSFMADHRRGLWVHRITHNSHLVAIQFTAGREGDDAGIMLVIDQPQFNLFMDAHDLVPATDEYSCQFVNVTESTDLDKLLRDSISSYGTNWESDISAINQLIIGVNDAN